MATTYNNVRIKGRVQAITSSPSQNNPNRYVKTWITKYADGYVARYTRKEL